MKLLFPIIFLSLLISSFAQPPGAKCRAYGGVSYYISRKDTLDFIGENRFEIAVHSGKRNEKLTGIYTLEDGVLEMTFDGPKGEEIRHKTVYTYRNRKMHYVKEGSSGFYGYKGQRFKYKERGINN